MVIIFTILNIHNHLSKWMSCKPEIRFNAETYGQKTLILKIQSREVAMKKKPNLWLRKMKKRCAHYQKGLLTLSNYRDDKVKLPR